MHTIARLSCVLSMKPPELSRREYPMHLYFQIHQDESEKMESTSYGVLIVVCVIIVVSVTGSIYLQKYGINKTKSVLIPLLSGVILSSIVIILYSGMGHHKQMFMQFLRSAQSIKFTARSISSPGDTPGDVVCQGDIIIIDASELLTNIEAAEIISFDHGHPMNGILFELSDGSQGIHAVNVSIYKSAEVGAVPEVNDTHSVVIGGASDSYGTIYSSEEIYQLLYAALNNNDCQKALSLIQ